MAGQLNKVTEEAYDQDDKLRKSMGQIEDFSARKEEDEDLCFDKAE